MLVRGLQGAVIGVLVTLAILLACPLTLAAYLGGGHVTLEQATAHAQHVHNDGVHRHTALAALGSSGWASVAPGWSYTSSATDALSFGWLWLTAAVPALCLAVCRVWRAADPRLLSHLPSHDTPPPR